MKGLQDRNNLLLDGRTVENKGKFSEDFLKWPQFRDNFVALISTNSALPKITKYHYFSSSLQGEVKALLEILPVTDINYDITWVLLCKRYNNKRIIANEHI